MNETAAKYLSHIGDLNHHNPKLLVCFAGVPGSGKTTLAKKLQSHFQGLRINSDEIRDILHAEESETGITEVNPYVQPVIAELFKHFPTSANGIVILDASVDRTYETYKGRAEAENYALFLINLELDENAIEQRIRARNGDGAEDYLRRMQGWQADHQKLLNSATPDFTWHESSSWEKLIDAINNKLAG